MNDLDADSKAKAPRDLFERSVQGLDLGTANRLRLGRRAALAGEGGLRGHRRSWLPALATAAMLVLGLAWWLPQRTPAPTPASSTAGIAPAELVEDGDDADLYAWLGEAPVAAESEPEQQL